METIRKKGNNMMKEQEEKKEVAKVDIDGDRWSWYYVCSECRCPVNWKQEKCLCCGRRLDWNV